MRRMHLIVAALLVGLLVATASPATAAPKRAYDFPVDCSGELIQMAWAPGWGSWTLHMEDGSSFVAHRWIVHFELMDDSAEPEVWLNRGHGSPLVECWAECPFSGTPIEIWGIRTPVRGR
jgi:hypothetical protein